MEFNFLKYKISTLKKIIPKAPSTSKSSLRHLLPSQEKVNWLFEIQHLYFCKLQMQEQQRKNLKSFTGIITIVLPNINLKRLLQINT